MNILRKEHIILSSEVQDKEELFAFLARHMVESNCICEEELKKFEEGLWEREKISVTGIGHEIAIPHIQSDIIREPTLVFMKSETKIVYESLDGDYVTLVFMIAIPEDAGDWHLNCLAKLSRALMNKPFRESLIQTRKIEDAYELISKRCNL